MKQIVDFSVLDQVVGGGKKQCNCCCYREPYIRDGVYGVVSAGRANSTGDCARVCMTNPAIYSGFKSCDDTLCIGSNKEIARDILYMRFKYGSFLPEVDINDLK